MGVKYIVADNPLYISLVIKHGVNFDNKEEEHFISNKTKYFNNWEGIKISKIPIFCSSTMQMIITYKVEN